MQRYFIEVSYKGTNYSGFQIQKNSNSIQAEVEKALEIFFKQKFSLTGASRTDAGVHALQNFFHFDLESLFYSDDFIYSLNALLPGDVTIKKIVKVPADMHCRYDATEREYKYYIYQNKDPFLADRAFYYPFKIDMERLNKVENELMKFENFASFSKRNTQVKNFYCSIYKSKWIMQDGVYVYSIISNRFLRGMVRGIVGTMLKVATAKISVDEFRNIIESKDCRRADFSVPPHGLFLVQIKYSSSI